MKNRACNSWVVIGALMLLATISGCNSDSEANNPPASTPPPPVVQPTGKSLGCGHELQRIIDASNLTIDSEPRKLEDVQLNVYGSDGKEMTSGWQLPFQQGRYYFILDWLPAAGIHAQWDRQKGVLLLRHQEDNECLILRADRPYATLVRCSNQVQFSSWWSQALHGINTLVDPPKVEAVRIKSTPLSFQGDPMMTLRVVVGALGDNKIDFNPPKNGKITADNPVKLDVHLPCTLEELAKAKAAPEAFHAPDFIDNL